jgi:RNA polymerase primary sigma factor
MGRERGYLLSDEINDVIADALSSEDTETLILTIERSGIDVYEDVSAADAARAALEVTQPIEAETKEEVRAGADDVELALTPGPLDKISDPVRMYLREMGTVPLLKRHEEVAIAKRIERGRLLNAKDHYSLAYHGQGIDGDRRRSAHGYTLDQGGRAVR